MPHNGNEPTLEYIYSYYIMYEKTVQYYKPYMKNTKYNFINKAITIRPSDVVGEEFRN